MTKSLGHQTVRSQAGSSLLREIMTSNQKSDSVLPNVIRSDDRWLFLLFLLMCIVAICQRLLNEYMDMDGQLGMLKIRTSSNRQVAM